MNKLLKLFLPSIIGMLFIAGGSLAVNLTAPQYGGTGQNTSNWTGCVQTTAGVWSTTSCGSTSATTTFNSILNYGNGTTTGNQVIVGNLNIGGNLIASASGLTALATTTFNSINTAGDIITTAGDIIATSGNISSASSSVSDTATVNKICFSGTGNCQTDVAVFGSDIDFFFHNASADIAGYETLRIFPNNGVEVQETATSSSGSYGFIDQYIATTTDLAITTIPAGAWTFNDWANIDSSVGDSRIIHSVYIRTLAGDEKFFFQATSSEMTVGLKEYIFTVVEQGTTTLATDRIVVKNYFWTDSGITKTITYYYDGLDYYSHINTPISISELDYTRATVAETITSPWTFSATTTFSPITISGNATIGGNATTTGNYVIGGNLNVGGTIYGNGNGLTNIPATTTFNSIDNAGNGTTSGDQVVVGTTYLKGSSYVYNSMNFNASGGSEGLSFYPDNTFVASSLLLSSSGNDLLQIGGISYNSTLSLLSLTTDRTQTLPDIDGTFLMASTTQNFNTSGKIGVGTTTPYATIDNTGSLRLLGMFYDSAGNPGTVGQFLMSTATSTYWVSTSTMGFTAGSGLTALNGESGSTQFFASSTTGTDFTITHTGDVHTFNIPSASAANRGLLTAADWSKFNLGIATTTFNSITTTGTSTLVGITSSGNLTVAGNATTTGNMVITGSLYVGTLYGSATNLTNIPATTTFNSISSPTASITNSTSSNAYATLSQTIPYGASPDVGSIGKIALDTSSGQLKVMATTTQVFTHWKTKGFTVFNATTTDDNVLLPVFYASSTITNVFCQTGTSTVAIVLGDGANSLESITCTTAGVSDDGSLTNATFGPLERFEYDTGAIGTVDGIDWVAITIKFTTDAD